MPKIALAQMHIDYDNADNNISTARDMLISAANAHCEWVVFPELWSTSFKLENCKKFIKINSPLLKEFQIFSDANNLEIFGSYLIQRKLIILMSSLHYDLIQSPIFTTKLTFSLL